VTFIGNEQPRVTFIGNEQLSAGDHAGRLKQRRSYRRWSGGRRSGSDDGGGGSDGGGSTGGSGSSDGCDGKGSSGGVNGSRGGRRCSGCRNGAGVRGGSSDRCGVRTGSGSTTAQASGLGDYDEAAEEELAQKKREVALTHLHPFRGLVAHVYLGNIRGGDGRQQWRRREVGGAGDERAAGRAAGPAASPPPPPHTHAALPTKFGRRRRPIQPDGARKWKPDASPLVWSLELRRSSRRPWTRIV
jgi:hypothetical protein